MATRKTPKATPTTKAATRFRSPRRPASVAATALVPQSIYNQLDTVSDIAAKGFRFGIGTILLVRENTTKFVDEAIEKGNEVTLTLPKLDLDRLEQLRVVPVEQLEQLSDTVGKWFHEGIKHVSEAVKQVSRLAQRRDKKVELEDEVLNIIATLDLPKKTDMKEFSQRINDLSKKIEKLSNNSAVA